ncbi:hypothetical protein MR813_04800 [bacterium]|nr:hypothetical protein [bacterium]
MTEFLQQPYFSNLMVVCAHISISFTICLILLVYRFNKTVGDRRFRILIGYCSMAYGISFIHNTIIFICMLYDVDKAVVEHFTSPVMAGMEISLCIFAILRFINIPTYLLKGVYISYYVTISLALLYPQLYVEYVKHRSPVVTTDYIEQYMETLFCRIFSIILIASILFTILLQMRLLIRLYQKALHSTREQSRERRIGKNSFRLMVILGSIFSVLLILETTPFAPPDCIIKHILWITGALALAAFIFNSKEILRINRGIFRNIILMEKSQETSQKTSFFNYSKTSVQSAELMEERMLIQKRLKSWEEEESMPYNRENLTIAHVSEETGIPTGVLSRYLKLLYGETFYEWIQRLRRKERQDPTLI